jgi:uncharacterized protein with HEPN domain
MRDERVLLDEILGALDRIDASTRELTPESFAADEPTRNAVCKNFLIIAEAAGALPEAVTGNYPEIPWRQIAGIRDKLPCASFAVDYALVWRTVTVVLPQFRAVIETIRES